MAVRWLGTKLMQRDYYERRKLAGRSPGNDEVSIICFPHKLNIVLEGGQGLRTRLEYYTPLKKKFILQSKGGHLQKIRRRA